MAKREVMVMGDYAFADYKASIQAYIGTLLDTAVSLEKRVETYARRVEEEIDLEYSRTLLLENQVELSKTRRHIDELKMHFLVIHEKWTHRNNRVIGRAVCPASPLRSQMAPRKPIDLINYNYNQLVSHEIPATLPPSAPASSPTASLSTFVLSSSIRTSSAT